MHIHEFRTRIDEAMKDGREVKLVYKNKSGQISERVVLPLYWESDSLFRAFCYLRNEKRTFNLCNVIECTVYGEGDTTAATPSANKFETVQDWISAEVIGASSMRHRKRHGASSPELKGDIEPFTKITSAADWERLLQYYVDCLIQENRQQFVLHDQALVEIPAIDVSTCKQCMQGSYSIKLNGMKASERNLPHIKMIRDARGNPTTQLCLGYPFWVIDRKKVAPLLYVPVEILDDGDDAVILQPTGVEVSYAALKEMQFTEEEIAAFLEECQALGSDIDALETLVLSKIDELHGRALPRSERVESASIFVRPALFSVKGTTATASLIKELRDLSRQEHWGDAPQALRSLLNGVPEHDIPPAAESQPGEIFVTPLNAQQMHALRTARSEPVMVVTGPPGTGKSQLVLNVLVDCVLRGQRVLFASRNNKAVDVVMERLQHEIGFRGAVRTGSKENRRQAAQWIREALAQIEQGGPTPNLEALRDAYRDAQGREAEAQAQLAEIKRLNGLLASYQDERDHYLSSLPARLQQIVRNVSLELRPQEVERFEQARAELLTEALKLKEHMCLLEDRLRQVLNPEGTEQGLMREVQRIRDQYGDFGGGLYRYDQTGQSPHALIAHITTWLTLVEVVEKRNEQEQLRERMRLLKSELMSSEDPMTYSAKIATQYSKAEIEALLNQARTLESRLKRLTRNRVLRIADMLCLNALSRRWTRSVCDFVERLGVPLCFETNGDQARARALAACSQLARLLHRAMVHKEASEVQTALIDLRKGLASAEAKLPERARKDLERFARLDFDNTALKAELGTIQQQAETIREAAEHLVYEINQLTEINEECLSTLEALKQSPLGSDKTLWHLKERASIASIVEHLSTWHNLLAYFKQDAGLRTLEDQITSMPPEDEVYRRRERALDEMLSIGGDILRAAWLLRVRGAPNEVLSGAHLYVDAVEALSDTYDRESSRTHKHREEANFPHALQIFPVWATTNLSAKQNLPLRSSLFDVVVIDEASQCDFASALPLLYRGGRVMIIGDPNQLRHVATLKAEDDQGLCAKHGVGIDAFSYTCHSLYDIAQRSVGAHPGVVLLTEHYRCDSRIIEFSNREFYDSRLIIKTDLTRRGISKPFISRCGGMFWINTLGGESERREGSWRNITEARCIQSLAKCLVQGLSRSGLERLTIGVVTPFRAQESAIRELFRQNPLLDKITVGTAHKFQGDERDIVIFSPVVAKGIEQGTIGWLRQTRNLLNVAVTRARITLLIVADWEFCHSLSADHDLRRLADYVAKERSRVVQSVEELPFFGVRPAEVIGCLTDPSDKDNSRITLRRFIASCRDYVWWIDGYFNNSVFDLWQEVFQESDVDIHEVRLLTDQAMVIMQEGRKPQLDRERYKAIRDELRRRGISFELRVLTKKSVPHDRFLYTKDLAVNMPPFLQAYGEHKRLSEYTESHTGPELFQSLWDQAERIE